MKSLRKEIVSCFEKYVHQDDLLIDELEKKISVNGERVYSLIFDVLTHLHIEPDRARQLWKETLAHRMNMKEHLGRDVGIRTAICDYLCSCKTLQNPMVVEINVFEKHYQSNFFDALTGLHSRQCLMPTMEGEIARARRHHTPLSVIFFDIDNFKMVNDTYGHIGGDECLITVASIIMDEIRAEDTAIRYGGEEILVILPQTDKMHTLVIGERIRKRIKGFQFKLNGTKLNITVSGGISTFPEDGQDSECLIRYADTAMYQAKGNGKDNIAMNSLEKRRYIRVDYRESIGIEIIGHEDASSVCAAYGKNVSRTGLLFEVPKVIEIGTRLMVTMHIAANAGEDGEILREKEMVRIQGVVVRNELNTRGRCSYDIGISFLEMDFRALEGISDHVDGAMERLVTLLKTESSCSE